MSGAPSARSLLAVMGSRASFLRLLTITAAIVVVFGVLRPTVFLSTSNLQFLGLASPELALLSLAIAVTMLTGGIDLSVVAIANLSGIVAGTVMIASGGSAGGVVAGSLAGLGAAMLAGAVNGAIVAGLRVTPILATLGTAQLLGGIGLVLTGGTAVKGLPPLFTDVARSTVAGVPVVFLLLLAVALVLTLLVSRTTLGFRMRMLGANPVAARYSGVRSGRVLVSTYVTSGLLAGVAGLVISSRASGADADYGTSYILLGIVVAVLAGVDPEGGYMTVAGVVIATLALLFLSTGLLALDVSSHVVNIAQGALLITMMVVNRYSGAWSRAVRERALVRIARPRRA
ncbi:MAG: ABC transporter, permease protein (cluster 2, ribose/xylose/arabinose/galactose) [uncultured Quadrisphaera sp.]|uniref:ABC transporter, permease protein (Cluster 2, ribose/xylose/arabinose/galactose) n=1 Tax=uncultured Quadrisphaera sp. TaxID=904978 RepID=A0A6J4PT62_9ACTN|nr:MAG: ABC transporter, permease protein (cluster 2, ribose/xylose/arabinose/galactose) [uncultured Quadrisphaera sp.]